MLWACAPHRSVVLREQHAREKSRAQASAISPQSPAFLSPGSASWSQPHPLTSRRTLWLAGLEHVCFAVYLGSRLGDMCHKGGQMMPVHAPAVMSSQDTHAEGAVCGEAGWTGLKEASGSSHITVLLRFCFLCPELTYGNNFHFQKVWKFHIFWEARNPAELSLYLNLINPMLLFVYAPLPREWQY